MPSNALTDGGLDGTGNNAGTGAPPAVVPAEAVTLQRLSGHKATSRHKGVTVHQKATHHPAHPHATATHAAKAPKHSAKTRPAKAGHTPKHSTHIHQSKLHLSAQPGLLELEVGTITAYTPPTASAAGMATVQILGASARVIAGIPMTQTLPTDLAPLGAQCLVALLDTLNPADALIVGVYNAPPARLIQAEGANVVVAANATQGTLHVTFPTAYLSAVHSVVATSQDPNWHALCRNLSTTGFDLVVQNVAPAILSNATYNTPNPNNASTLVVQTAGAVAGTGNAGGGGVTVVCDWFASGV